MDQLVKLGGICIGTKVNTIVKYNTIIEIIIEAITLHTKHMNGQLDLQLALSLAPLGNDRRSMAITSPLFPQLASIQEETYLLWLVNPVYLLVDHLAKDYLLFSSGVPCPQKQTTNQPADRLPFIHLLFIQL